MHFNMKVLKLERGHCSAVYKALLYFVLKIVWALRENEPQLTWAIAINHIHPVILVSLSVCLKSILMDRYVAITGFWHLGFNMNIYCFFNGIDTVRNTIASTLHNEKKSWTCQRTLSEILLLTETNRAVKYFFSILKNPNLIFFCCVKYCEMQLKMTSIHLS